MKYSLQELLTGVETVNKCVPGKCTLAILKYIRLTIKKDKLILMATDLEDTGFYTIEQPSEIEIDVCVEANTLKTSLGMLTDYVRFEMKKAKDESTNEVLCMSDASTTCRAATLSGTEYPDFPETPIILNKSFFSSDYIQNLLAIMKPSVSTDFTRQSLTGIYFHADGMVATDGHKLSFLQEKSCKLNSIIRPKTLKLMGKPRLAISIGEVELRGDDKALIPSTHIIVESGKFMLYSKVIEGPYPKYKNAMPASYVNHCVFTRKDMLNILKKMEPITNRKTSLVAFHFTKDIPLLTIKAKNYDNGMDVTKEYPLRLYDGKEISIGMSCAYLIELLNTFEGGVVTMEFNSALGPIRISESYNEINYRILMPLRLKEEDEDEEEKEEQKEEQGEEKKEEAPNE